jgi:cobalt-zinc-cadmium efflux system protein
VPGHDHDYRAAVRAADRRYLATALGLLAAFMVAEVIVAALAGSLALLADAGHMVADAGALAGSLWAARLAVRPAYGIWTFGLQRAEILAAAANGVVLLVVAALVLWDAVRRLVSPPRVEGGPILAVALIGVAVNLLATAVLARADRRSLNVAAAFAHLLTDLWAFLATAAAGAAIIATGYRRADPLASLVAVVFMVLAAWRMLRASGRVLLEGAPEQVDLGAVRDHLLGTGLVRSVHDLHAWTVTSDLPAISAHVVVDERCFVDGAAPRILDEVQRCLAGHFDVAHSTFQLEPAGHTDHEAEGHP